MLQKTNNNIVDATFCVGGEGCSLVGMTYGMVNTIHANDNGLTNKCIKVNKNLPSKS